MATNTQYRERNEELIEQLAGTVTEVERDQIESELYKANVPLIHHVVRSYKFPFEYNERFSICAETFAKIIRNYDDSKGTSFASYFALAMKRSLNKYHRDMNFDKRRPDLPNVSFENKVIRDGRERSFYEIVPDTDSNTDPSYRLEQNDLLKYVLQFAWMELTPNQYKCFVNYLKEDHERLTQGQMAEYLNVSQMHVSRLTRQGIQKIKDHFEQLEGSRL